MSPASVFDWGMTVFGLASFALLLVTPVVGFWHECLRDRRDEKRGGA